jgi:hypothetical protein
VLIYVVRISCARRKSEPEQGEGESTIDECNARDEGVGVVDENVTLSVSPQPERGV